MNRSAKVNSIEAIHSFKLTLQRYEERVRDAIVNLTLEIRRGLDWIENEQTQYWRRQSRKASDALHEARSALSRCEMAISTDNTRSCFDEKKALERARRRQREVEEKIRIVQKWAIKARHEVEQLDGQIHKMTNFLDADLMQAMAALEKMHAALSQYASSNSVRPRADSTSSSLGPVSKAADQPEPTETEED